METIVLSECVTSHTEKKVFSQEIENKRELQRRSCASLVISTGEGERKKKRGGKRDVIEEVHV